MLSEGNNETYWQALVARDPRSDGVFVYSVRTTGIYCRPTCPARLALREHVAFHSHWQAAEQSGFRPCKRCDPKGGGALAEKRAMLLRICHHIEQSETKISLKKLAPISGLSPFHFQKLFKATLGLTPKEYAQAYRAQRLQEILQNRKGDPSSQKNSPPSSYISAKIRTSKTSTPLPLQNCQNLRSTITEAFYEAGFNSSGAFYGQSSNLLGMEPHKFRKGGEGSQICVAVSPCTLGYVLVAVTARGVCAIFLGDDPLTLREEMQARFPKAQWREEDEKLQTCLAHLMAYIDNPRVPLNLPLDLQGTLFQYRVWNALQKIPLGEVATYEEISQKIGQPKAARAVARACASNPAALAIPCHRVIHKKGTLSGYRWGVNRKTKLLAQEKAAASETEQEV